MIDATPRLGLPLIAAAQAQKHVTHNEALGLLDALVQLACLDKDLTAPPPSPGAGDRYLVTAAHPGGAWAGLSGQVVRFEEGVWIGAVPRPGWFAYVIDEADLYLFDGTAWTSFRRAITAIQVTSRLGINTDPDGTNRLAVKSDAALLSWDDITPGSGDMRVAVNKRAAPRDAGLVFQTGYSARALLGTLGGDDFTLKVSGDGAAFATVFTASAATGGIDFASAETNLASAATTDLAAAGTRRVLVTGSATVTSFGTGPNRERLLRFAGAATLTHDAAKLVLPTQANIVTAAADTCLASSDAAGNWRVHHYQRADGTALVGGGVASVAGRTGAVTLAVADVPGAAPTASPSFTGTPTAPTATAGTNSAQIATTAFVASALASGAGSGGGASPASFRRRNRNGNFAVNQRGVSGTVTLAAGAYGHDGWKAGSGGCTYTFSAAASGDVTLTITAGSLLQILEGTLCIPEGGAYILSWSGSATGRVYQGSASGSYAASPVAATGLTGGKNTIVEFGTGTLGLVQFEPGTAATPFERRDDELRRCQRYYETGQTYIYGQSYAAGASLSVPTRLATKAYTPNVALSGVASSNMNTPNAAVTGLQDVLFYATSTAASGTVYYQFNWTASAEL